MNTIDPDARDRTFGNLDVVFEIETPVVSTFVPDTDVLASVKIPVHSVYGEETTEQPLLRMLIESTEWLAKTTGGPLHVFPGAHAAFVNRADGFAEALRPILASMS